jgi:hypothetical protein
MRVVFRLLGCTRSLEFLQVVKAVAEKPADLKINSRVDAIACSSTTTKILGLFFTGRYITV